MYFANLGVSVLAKDNKSTNEDKLVNVTIYEDSETIIIAQVPKSKEQKYLKEIQNEKYRNAEIQKYLGGINKNTTEGMTTNNTIYGSPDIVKYFGKYDVIQTLKAMDRYYNWERYLSNPFTDAAIGRIISLVSKNNVIGWAAATLWTIADLSNRQEQWWKDTFIMIARGQARGAKLEITYNRFSNYPAAWIILSRY